MQRLTATRTAWQGRQVLSDTQFFQSGPDVFTPRAQTGEFQGTRTCLVIFTILHRPAKSAKPNSRDSVSLFTHQRGRPCRGFGDTCARAPMPDTRQLFFLWVGSEFSDARRRLRTGYADGYARCSLSDVVRKSLSHSRQTLLRAMLRRRRVRSVSSSGETFYLRNGKNALLVQFSDARRRLRPNG